MKSNILDVHTKIERVFIARMEVFMKVLKRNQIIIFLLALMLVTAGYLSTTSNQDWLQTSVSTSYNNTNVANSIDDSSTIGDATFVNGGALVENEDENTILNNTIDTSNTNVNEEDNYFSDSKLQRDTMYSQSLDSYQKMLDSTTISSEQKAIAQNEITRINNEKNAIMISENLIKTKGFEDIVIFINGDSINAVIKSDKLSQEEIAQIQNVLSRELNSDIANIHISNK